MWGNKQGWMISAVVAVVMGLLLYVVSQPGSPTPPTGKLTLGQQPANLPVDPATVLPAPSGDEDAAPLYRKAAEEYAAHEQDYEKFASNPKAARDAVPAAVKLLLQAATARKMNLFTASPAEVVNYEADRTVLDSLNNVGTLCNQIALVYAVENNPDETRKYTEAAFNLGRHLYEERLVFTEWSDGITLMLDAADRFQRVEKDAAKAEADKAFAVEGTAWRREKVTALWQIVNGISDSDKAMYAGDIFQMAGKQNPERMWRVEAILKTGRYRFNAATRGDQLGAKKILADLVANDKDPVIHQAATTAHDLTIEGYRMLR